MTAPQTTDSDLAFRFCCKDELTSDPDQNFLILVLVVAANGVADRVNALVFAGARRVNIGFAVAVHVVPHSDDTAA